ncbi:MAG: SirB2 family protein [Burkholderiales bacterium]
MDAAEAYQAVRALHIGCAFASIAGFAARGVLMLGDSPLLRARFVRIAPHVVDTVLLASALWLAWFLGQVPFVHGWITAKVLALLAYIVLGSIALKRGRSKGRRAAAFAAALAVAAYIVAVALARDPAPWSALWS